MNTGRWLFKRSLVSPQRPAVLFEAHTLTYEDLNRRVNRVAHAILGWGLSAGDRVGVLSRNCPQFLEVYFACAKTGLIFVPLNFRLAPPEVAYQISDSGLKALFFHAELSDLVRKATELLAGPSPIPAAWAHGVPPSVPSYEGLLEEASADEPPPAPTNLDTPQMIMYTSGTTGTPKGALLSHGKTLFNTLNAQIYFDLGARDTMLLVLPLFHSGGLNIMAVPTLYVGGRIILRDRFDPRQFLKDVETFGVTQAMLVPTMLNTILKEARAPDFDLSTLRAVLIGGEPASAQLVREAQDQGLPVRQIFGQTETSIELWVPPEMAREKAGAVGLPVFHGEVQVVDPEGRPVRPGEIGEIVVRGPIQMLSYWNMPEETRETIRDGWLHTRDLGRVDEEGFVYAVDRMGDMYISGGENVYPAEVEKVLLGHPKIYEAAIVGIPHPRWGKVGHAFIKPRQGMEITLDEVVSFLKDRVAAYKIPRSMEIIEEFPKTASGKIKKSELRKDIETP